MLAACVFKRTYPFIGLNQWKSLYILHTAWRKENNVGDTAVETEVRANWKKEGSYETGVAEK